MKVSSRVQKSPARSPQGGRGRCRGETGEAPGIAQAAWILLLTLLKPRVWSTLGRNSSDVFAILLISVADADSFECLSSRAHFC